jgi:hypothetical protein
MVVSLLRAVAKCAYLIAKLTGANPATSAVTASRNLRLDGQQE